MLKKFNPSHYMITFLLLSGFPLCEAAINIKLQEPRWEFLLNNQYASKTDAQLSSNESTFARKIQPLLAEQKHAEVLQAFAERSLENDSAALQLLRGQVLLNMRKIKEAETALKAALKSVPDLALAHRSLSLVYMLDKRYQPARQHLTRSIELGVADAQVYGQLAFVNLQLDKAASAVAGYQYALLLDPDNTQWHQGLLYALIKAQAFDQAQALLEEALQSDPDNPDLWLQRGQIALKQERSLQALSSLEVALGLGENSAENIATAAQLHIQNGSPKRAVVLLADNIQQLIQGSQNKIEVVEQICGWLAYQQDWHQLNKILRSLKQKKVRLPAITQSRFDVYDAQIALSKGELKRAHKQLKKAIAADPTNGEALLSLAKILRKQEQADRALLFYVRAAALPLFKERALLNHAQLEIDRKNYTEALRVLRLVVQANPARTDVQANIQSLENLGRL